MNRILPLAPSAIILLVLAGCSDAHVEAKPESMAVSASSLAVASGSAMPLPTPAPSPTPSASAAPTDADARTLTFSTRDVVVGARYHTHLTNHMELDATIVIKTLHSVSDEDTELDTDILAVSHGTATKAKLTYTKVARTRTMDGVSKPNPGPVAGRSYVVERVGDKVAITAADAKPLSEDELRALRTFMGSFGKPDRVAKTLAAKPRRTGDHLDDVALAMKERYDSDHLETEQPGDQSTLSDITATLSGVERIDGSEVGMVEVTSTMTGKQGGADMTLKTHGKIAFRIESGESVLMNVEGASTMSKGLMTGSGKMLFRVETTPLSAKPQ